MQIVSKKFATLKLWTHPNGHIAGRWPAGQSAEQLNTDHYVDSHFFARAKNAPKQKAEEETTHESRFE